MKFLIDVQLPLTLSRWLDERGCDTIHALERNLGTATDSERWLISINEQRIRISRLI